MAGIPKQYAFLSAVGVLPRTITHGLSTLGTNEVPGSLSNAVILAWRDELNKVHPGSIVGYSTDSIPWCGLHAALIAHRAGKEPVDSPLWARNWKNFGEPVAVNDGTESAPKLRFVNGRKASLGDNLTFVRPGGGHVGWYIAEDNSHYHVLGGNQSDSVTITRVAKARCIAVRRAPMRAPPASVRPYVVAPNGTISINEQ